MDIEAIHFCFFQGPLKFYEPWIFSDPKSFKVLIKLF